MKTLKSNGSGQDVKAVPRSPRIYAVPGNQEVIPVNPPRIKKRKIPKYLRIFVAVLGIYLAALFVIGSYQLWQVKKQIDVLNIEQKALLNQQQKLKDEMESLNSPEMIERIARESLRMVKPGETVIIPAASNKPGTQ